MKVTSVPKISFGLGWAGVLPFLISAILVWMPSPFFYEAALHALLIYGAIILSFLGGVHWGLELRQSEKLVFPISGYSVSVIPALLAFMAVFMQPFWGLMILEIGFLGMAFYDYKMLVRKGAPDWYGKLRIQLTTAVLICLFLGQLALGINSSFLK